MRETPADGPAIADDKVRDMRHGDGNDRDMPRDHRGHLERVMSGERANPQACAWLPVHVAEPGNAVDVDECCGTQQADVEQRDEALDAGKQLGIAAEAPECGERVGEAQRLQVVESSRFHRCEVVRDITHNALGRRRGQFSNRHRRRRAQPLRADKRSAETLSGVGGGVAACRSAPSVAPDRGRSSPWGVGVLALGGQIGLDGPRRGRVDALGICNRRLRSGKRLEPPGGEAKLRGCPRSCQSRRALASRRAWHIDCLRTAARAWCFACRPVAGGRTPEKGGPSVSDRFPRNGRGVPNRRMSWIAERS